MSPGRKRRTQPKLVWDPYEDRTVDGRFSFERIVRPDVYCSLIIDRTEDSALAFSLNLVLTTETPAKAKALAQRIADWSDGVYPIPENPK